MTAIRSKRHLQIREVGFMLPERYKTDCLVAGQASVAPERRALSKGVGKAHLGKMGQGDRCGDLVLSLLL